jgi:2-hydroxychromene-2-carboxylate isomerase
MNGETPSMRTFDWYFDFISPFSYLQCERIARGSAELSVDARPIVFAGLLEHWGHKGPAEIPAKRIFTYRQVQWLAERDGVPLRFPPRHPFNPIRVLRLAVALNADLGAIRAIFGYIWGEGGAVDTPEGWTELTHRLGIDDAQARVADPEVKARLRRNGEAAIAAGVFGVPTLALDGMLFWGYDATAMALDYLRDPERFRKGELGRVAELPVGVSRV